MTAKHTPGPWAFDGESRIDALQFRKLSPHKYKDDDGIEREFMEGLVALPYACGGNGTHEANARLIAAAPDLLAALIDVRDNVRGDSPNMWALVDAAIAKAIENAE